MEGALSTSSRRSMKSSIGTSKPTRAISSTCTSSASSRSSRRAEGPNARMGSVRASSASFSFGSVKKPPWRKIWVRVSESTFTAPARSTRPGSTLNSERRSQVVSGSTSAAGTSRRTSITGRNATCG